MTVAARIVLVLVPLVVLASPPLSAPVAAGGASGAQVAPPLHVFQQFVGDWTGKSQGKFGPADLEKTWSFALNDNFLHCRTKSVAKGDLHRDWRMLSYDRERQKFVLREFHSEGYVNQYVVTLRQDGAEVVYETESVENGFAPGLRAQTRVRFVSADEIHQTFSLAAPGKEWEICVESTLRRQKPSKEDR